MVTAASTLFAVNGTVSKVILTNGGISSLRLTELRATGAFLGLAAFVLVTAPGRLRVARDELALLVFYGIVGFALVQWLYLVAIERLPIGIGLLLEFTAPCSSRSGRGSSGTSPCAVGSGRRSRWRSSGLVLVGEVWEDVRLDTVGVVAGLLAAGALATYYLAGEHQTARRDALSLTCLSLGVAAVFWAVLQPWWGFPFDALGATVSLEGSLDAVERAGLGPLPLDDRPRHDPAVRALARRAAPSARDAGGDRLDDRGRCSRRWSRGSGSARRSPRPSSSGGGVVLVGVVLAQTSR